MQFDDFISLKLNAFYRFKIHSSSYLKLHSLESFILNGYDKSDWARFLNCVFTFALPKFPENLTQNGVQPFLSIFSNCK